MLKELEPIIKEIIKKCPNEDEVTWSIKIYEMPRELSKIGYLESFDDDLAFLSKHLGVESTILLYKTLQNYAPLKNWKHTFLNYFGHFIDQLQLNENIKIKYEQNNDKDDIPM